MPKVLTKAQLNSAANVLIRKGDEQMKEADTGSEKERSLRKALTFYEAGILIKEEQFGDTAPSQDEALELAKLHARATEPAFRLGDLIRGRSHIEGVEAWTSN